MLALLQDHARHHGDQLAHVLPDRDITYGRLWSRIERGSARLYGEWGVRRGDRVAYIGRGHPDAIVLYFALLRIGAVLLPLEAMSVTEVRRRLTELPPTLVIQDDAVSDVMLNVLAGPISEVISPAVRSAYPLQALLATWSHHEPVVMKDAMAATTLWLPDAARTLNPTTLDQLCVALPSTPRSTFIDQKIFSVDLLRNIVLPALRDRQLMQFSATDRISGTGS